MPIGEEINLFICNLKCSSYLWSGTLIMEFWFQAWKCPFYAPLRFQTHNEIMIAVRPAAAAVIWHVYHSIKTPNTLRITFDSYSKYLHRIQYKEVFFIPYKEVFDVLIKYTLPYMYCKWQSVHTWNRTQSFYKISKAFLMSYQTAL